METQKNLREIRPFPCNPKSLNKQMLRRILAVSFTVVSLFIALCCLAAASMAAVRLFFLMSQNCLLYTSVKTQHLANGRCILIFCQMCVCGQGQGKLPDSLLVSADGNHSVFRAKCEYHRAASLLSSVKPSITCFLPCGNWFSAQKSGRNTQYLVLFCLLSCIIKMNRYQEDVYKRQGVPAPGRGQKRSD